MIKLPEEEELISGNFEKIGLAGGIYSIKINGSKIKKEAFSWKICQSMVKSCFRQL